MKKEIIIIVFVGLFVFSASGQNPLWDKNWEVVFQDDFSSPNINTNIWTVLDNFDHEEIQVHRSQNVYINNGKLVFETKKENYCCPPAYVNDWACIRQWKTGECYKYTSGYVQSTEMYKYGYFEIYAKLPGDGAYWPAFWFWGSGVDETNNNCWYNEIDIFEVDGCVTDSISNNHPFYFECPPGAKHGQFAYFACNYANSYHWYGLEWDSDKITWYIDNNIVRQVANNMDGIGIQNPLRLTMNVALNDNADCSLTANTVFPAYMYVDDANAYRLKCDKNTVVNEIYNYNTFNYAVKKSISLSGVSSLSFGQNVSLRATDFIELKAGFEVPLGAELYLGINSCE